MSDGGRFVKMDLVSLISNLNLSPVSMMNERAAGALQGRLTVVLCMSISA